jgi:DHA2 family multidrug resistance protein
MSFFPIHLEPQEPPPGLRNEQDLSVWVQRLSVRRRWIILLSLGLVCAVEISNRISINVILPDMQGNVAANSDEISWVLILYNIGFICSMILSAGMTRYLGNRRHFLYSIAIYSIGAMGCFLSAHNLDTLLASRLLMGFGGGAFLVRMVVLSWIFFPGTSRVKPFTWTLILLFAVLFVYPTAMGAIDDASHWNYAFLLDFLPLSIGTVLILIFLPSGGRRMTGIDKRLDMRGMVLLIVGMLTLQTALSRGERDLWFDSPLIVSCLVVSLLCLILFLAWELHPANDKPVLNLRLIMEEHALRSAFGITMIMGALLGASLYVLPQYLRNVQNFSATQTGNFFSIYGGGLGTGFIVSSRLLVPKLGGWRTTLLGFVLLATTLTIFIYTWTPDTPTRFLALILFIQGIAIAPIAVGISNLALGKVPLEHMSDTDATYYFVRQMGNTFGVTAVAVIFDRRLTLHSSRLLDVANRLDPTVRTTLAAYASVVARKGGGAHDPSLGALQIFQNVVVVQTRLLTFIDISFFLAVLCVVGIILTLFAHSKIKQALSHLHTL